MMYILIALAAIFNCISDVLLWHFDTSIFKNLKKEWWNPNLSWMYIKPFLGWVRLDAWHLFKFGMLFSFIGAVYIGRGVWWIELLTWGIVWELFWRILKK